MTPEEIRALDEATLIGLIGDLSADLERRRSEATLPRQMEAMNRQYLESSGVEPGQAWRQPLGAHDAYPKGWTVTHGGKDWESLTEANVWKPGVSGWREVTADGGGAAEWVAPTGSHDAYQTGDTVTFEGAEYQSLIDGNTWSPTAYPQGWTQL